MTNITALDDTGIGLCKCKEPVKIMATSSCQSCWHCGRCGKYGGCDNLIYSAAREDHCRQRDMNDDTAFSAIAMGFGIVALAILPFFLLGMSMMVWQWIETGVAP